MPGIAAEPNAAGLPTKHGGAWHASSVWKIYARA